MGDHSSEKFEKEHELLDSLVTITLRGISCALCSGQIVYDYRLTCKFV